MSLGHRGKNLVAVRVRGTDLLLPTETGGNRGFLGSDHELPLGTRGRRSTPATTTSGRLGGRLILALLLELSTSLQQTLVSVDSIPKLVVRVLVLVARILAAARNLASSDQARQAVQRHGVLGMFAGLGRRTALAFLLRFIHHFD